jgi:CheY-like chemotaxis protein
MSTILIVDDHPAFRLVIKMHLAKLLGVNDVFEADNGQTAVEIARQHLPDLAILDLDIPRINGLDVIRISAFWCCRVKTLQPLRRAPCVREHRVSSANRRR